MYIPLYDTYRIIQESFVFFMMRDIQFEDVFHTVLKGHLINFIIVNWTNFNLFSELSNAVIMITRVPVAIIIAIILIGCC